MSRLPNPSAPASALALSADAQSRLLQRMDAALETIEREYAEYNEKHAARKQRRIIPALFFAFYRSELCMQLISAAHAYLCAFVASPVQAGETITGAGPDSSRGPAHDSNLGGKKLRALQSHLHRVAECWAAVLMYRAEVNQAETITVSRTGKKSEHFLNPSFDTAFFEALFLLLEYCCEALYLEHVRQQVREKTGGATTAQDDTQGTTNGEADKTSDGTTHTGASAPLSPATAAAVAPKSKSGAAAALALAASVESNWRVAQHELQRILRSRNFSYSLKIGTQRGAAAAMQAGAPRGNGLRHVPLAANSVQTAAATSRNRHSPQSHKGSASYRSPATFRLESHGLPLTDDPDAAVWEDDTRALSHLPGHFKTRGSLGIVDCLDLRSPIITAALKNPRSLHSANEAYIFGAEAKRASARSHARLTHAEEQYLTAHHALQAQRALEWKMRMERDEREEAAAEEAEERRAAEELRRRAQPAESSGLSLSATAVAAASESAPTPPLTAGLQPRPPLSLPRASSVIAGALTHDAPPDAARTARGRTHRQQAGGAEGSNTARPAGRLRPLSLPSGAATARKRATLDEALAAHRHNRRKSDLPQRLAAVEAGAHDAPPRTCTMITSFAC